MSLFDPWPVAEVARLGSRALGDDGRLRSHVRYSFRGLTLFALNVSRKL